MNKEIFERLEQLEIEYEKIEHPVMFTMEEIAEYGLNSHGHIPKNLVLRDVKGTRNMLVLVHGDKRADLRLIRDEIDSTDWFQIGKGVCQGCVLSPCLFNLYAEYVM